MLMKLSHLHADETKTTGIALRIGRGVGLPVIDSDNFAVTVVQNTGVERGVVCGWNNIRRRSFRKATNIGTYTRAKRDHACPPGPRWRRERQGQEQG